MEENHINYNPQNIDVQELTLVNDLIRKTNLELKELEGEKGKALNDSEGVRNINEFIKIKKADLARFKQERKDILRGYDQLV